MNIRLADRIWQACLSSLQLDRYLMGELSEPGPAQVRAHLASCAQCNAVALGRKAEQAQPLPALRLVAEAAVIPRLVPPGEDAHDGSPRTAQPGASP